MSAVRLAKQHRAAGMDGQLDRMKQLPDRLAGPVDLASTEREDDHDAAGRREVDVVDGCLGNVGHPRSYVCTSGGTTATGQLAIGWAGTCGIAGRPSRLGSSSRPTSVARARDESQAATYLAAE